MNQAEKLINFQKAFERELPLLTDVAGTLAMNHYKMSFVNQGFTDKSLKRWKRRKNNVDPDRAILIKTGRLRDSIGYRKTSPTKLEFKTTVEYAQIHNEGGTMWHGGIMPKRQFMGYSYVLSKKIEQTINNRIMRLFSK